MRNLSLDEAVEIVNNDSCKSLWQGYVAAVIKDDEGNVGYTWVSNNRPIEGSITVNRIVGAGMIKAKVHYVRIM